MILARPVYPRASLMALMVASVPEFTRRIRSTGATRPMISAARSVSEGVGAPKDRPLAATRWTASTTAGWACPRIIGPQEHTRSTYSLPSASVRRYPLAEVMNRGVPPTELNARTGEFTPPGMSAHASAKSAAEVAVAGEVLRMATSLPAESNRSTTGCRSGGLCCRGA